MPTRALDDRGVTLAETLVATAVIGIGLVALAGTLPLSSYGVHEGRALSTATFLAEQKLEEIRNAAWTTTSPTSPAAVDCLGTGGAPTSTMCTRSQPTRCTSGSPCTTYADERPSEIAGYPAYSRAVRIWDCAQAPAPETGAGCAGVANAGMRLVRVTVGYAPIAAAAGAARPADKTATLEMLVATRQ